MLIVNGKLIRWGEYETIEKCRAIRIVDDLITEIDDQSTLIDKYPDDEILDAQGQYVMPGNICAHTHFYGVFSRGMAIPGPAAKDFPEILNKLWWPLDRALNEDTVRLSAAVCIIDAIKHGTTTVFDHHASGNYITGSLNTIAKVVEKSGLRASLCYELSDRDGERGIEEGIAENVSFINNVKKNQPANGRIQSLFGMHASFTVSKQTVRKAVNSVGDDVGFHIHVAEHSVDEYDSIEKYGTRIIDRLKDEDVLRKNSIIAHGVHIDAKEIALLAETGAWVGHQPRSNMNNAVGMSDVQSMLRMGVNVVLGNDGFSNAMWQEWKMTYLAHKLWNNDPRWMNGMDLKKIAVDNNAKLANQAFNANIGVLEAGAKADIIFVDYTPYTPISTGNLPWHILFGFRDSMVTMTMVDGLVLMKDRKLLTMDEKAINEETQVLVPELWERYNAQF
jgi:putative selenium metabolism protein SsnA